MATSFHIGPIVENRERDQLEIDVAKTLKDLISSAMVEEQLRQQAAADVEAQRKQFKLEQFELAIARLLPTIYPLLDDRRVLYLEGDEAIAFQYEGREFYITWFHSRAGSYSHLQIEHHAPFTLKGRMFAEGFHDDPKETERRFVVGLGNLMADLQTTPHELTRLPAPTLDDDDDDDDDEASGGAWRISELYTAAWLAFFAPSGWRAYAAAVHLHSVLRSVYDDLYDDAQWDSMKGPSDDHYRAIAERHGLPTHDGEVA